MPPYLSLEIFLQQIFVFNVCCIHVYQAAVDKEDQSFPCVCVSPELNINDHLLVTPLMPPPHQSNLESRINKDLYK